MLSNPCATAVGPSLLVKASPRNFHVVPANKLLISLALPGLTSSIVVGIGCSSSSGSDSGVEITSTQVESPQFQTVPTPDVVSLAAIAIDPDSRAVGATGVFDPRLDGRKLTFRTEDGGIVDNETGSVWNILGEAIQGPLSGGQLAPVVHANHFWFAWAAFKPDTLISTRGRINASPGGAARCVRYLKGYISPFSLTSWKDCFMASMIASTSSGVWAAERRDKWSPGTSTPCTSRCM